jgi:DNA-3-methyladenine glycosylase I
VNQFEIRPLQAGDRLWVAHLLQEHWGSPQVVSRGRVHSADQLPGFIALQAAKQVGLVTYHIEGDACEIVSLDSLVEGIGIGAALIEAVKDAALAAGCTRLWLITTNDNLHALRFYQKHGFVLAALHRNALEVSRRLKPQIPLAGLDGIPLRDEIELEMRL